MRQDLPVNIQNTSHDLEVDALVRLFEIRLANNTIFRLCPSREVTWRGKLYEQVPVQLTGIERNSGGKLNRPKLSLVNPDGMFTGAVHRGELDHAEVTRLRILRPDLEANRDFAIREIFRVARIVTLQKNMVVVELRDVLDGHYFEVPARKYQPPEFPFVRLS